MLSEQYAAAEVLCFKLIGYWACLTCGMVGHFVNSLTPSRMSASLKTFLVPYCAPAAVTEVDYPLERTLGAVDCTQHQVFLSAEQNLSEVDSSRKTALTICIKDSASHVAEATLGCFRDTLHNVQQLGKSSQTGTRVGIRHGCRDFSGHACESVEHML